MNQKHLKKFRSQTDVFYLQSGTAVVFCVADLPFFWTGLKDGADAKVCTGSCLLLINKAFCCL